jgi:hypothetical protein
MRRLGKDLIESAQEALAIPRGEATPARLFEPSPIDVAGIRKRLGLSAALVRRGVEAPQPRSGRPHAVDGDR